MIETVIQHHLPDHWDADVSYNGRYELINVETDDKEYQTVTAPFAEMNVTSVQRLQNPYIYGRYKLGKERLKIAKPSYMERIMYHPIAEIDKILVAEYNCDYRRYSTSSGSQQSGKNPLFYDSPLTARQSFSSHAACIVVVNVMNTQNAEVASNNRDGEYYPEYFVSISN